MKKCKCGKKIIPAWTFCEDCGKQKPKEPEGIYWKNKYLDEVSLSSRLAELYGEQQAILEAYMRYHGRV